MVYEKYRSIGFSKLTKKALLDLRKTHDHFKVTKSEASYDFALLITEATEKSSIIGIEVGYELLDPKTIFIKLTKNEGLSVDVNVFPSSFQIIGSILHLNLKPHQLPYKIHIGTILLLKISNVKTVINKINDIQNEFRTVNYEILAGSSNLVTTVNENNCKFTFDYGQVYFNTKLATIRRLILNELQPTKTLVDVFAGVGPLSIPAVKKGLKVYANDLNPNAIYWMKKCIEQNKIHNNITVYNKEGFDFLEELNHLTIDYFFLNLPEKSLDYIKTLLKWKGARVFAFFFHPNENYIHETIIDKIGDSSYQYKVEEVRDVSPNKKMFLLDFIIK